MLVTLNDVVAGMRVAEDIFLPNGMILLNCDTVLSENLINRLKKYGIERIQIAQELPPEQESVIPDDEAPPPSHEVEDNAPEEQIDNVETPDAAAPEEKPFTLPKITVTSENNGLSSFLKIEPAGVPNEGFTIDDLQNVLQDNNILFGINMPLLAEAVKKWQQSKNIIEIENVAQGIPPTPAKEGELELTVKHINAPKDLELVKKAKRCWELMNSSIPIQRVEKGMVIAKKEIKTPAIPGQSIHGDEITIDEVIKTEVKLGDNVEENKEDNTYRSTVTGLAYYLNGVVGAVPLNFDGTAEVSISPDRMKADLILHPAMEGGMPPAEKMIKELLSEKKITFGIRQEILADTLQNLSLGRYPEGPVTIAEGIPPIKGENGRIEYFFNAETSLKPKEDSQGKVDFKNVSIIHTVTKGEKLARLIPPTTGNPGKDIAGNDIPFAEGTPAALPTGANTQPSPEDPGVLVAAIDGNVRIKGNKIEIYEGFVIAGDVDYSTGNVAYDKSVSIKGDIKSGFTVNCGGDLEVGGTIEDAKITLGGNLLCRYGFIGQGKGIIESEGDVNLGFMKNQTIRSKSNVNIAREALNCKIFARGSVTVSGKPLSIAGGAVVARDAITCNVVGNASGILTTLEVGIDFTLLEELEKTEKQAVEIVENRQKLVDAMKRLEQVLAVRKKLPPKEEFLYTKLKNTIARYDSQNKALEDRKNVINAKLHNADKAIIKIQHSAQIGTLFKIGQHHYYVHQEIIGPKTIRLINHEIRVM